MKRSKAIFLIGPGGTGKSSCGPMLASLVSARFVDLDFEVCERIMDIPQLVESRGYAAYCETNASVAEQLVAESRARIVMATSSGFLTHDEQPNTVARNLDLVRRTGTSVLVIPDIDDEISAVRIAQRQAARYGAETYEHWLSITRRRIPLNRNIADVELVLGGSPSDIATAIASHIVDGGLLTGRRSHG